jgi:hypothetical protein
LENVRIRAIIIAVATVLTAYHPRASIAALSLQIERISDTQAAITATGDIGSIAASGNADIIALDDPFGTAPTGFANGSVFDTSTLSIGGLPVDFAYNFGPSFGWFASPGGVYFGDSASTPFPVNSAFVGELDVTLTAGTTLAAIGSTGNVYWGAGIDTPILVGTWNVVGVPEPASIVTLVVGLLGLSGFRRGRGVGSVGEHRI